MNQNRDRVELWRRFWFLSRVQDCANLEGSTTRSEGLSWTIECGLARVGSLESESEASLCVEVYLHSLLLIRYRVIRFNCKLCTCVHHFWSIYSQITRLVIWGETYPADREDDTKAGELPNQTICVSLSQSFTFHNFVNFESIEFFVFVLVHQKFNCYCLIVIGLNLIFVTCLGLI